MDLLAFADRRLMYRKRLLTDPTVKQCTLYESGYLETTLFMRRLRIEGAHYLAFGSVIHLCAEKAAHGLVNEDTS